MSELLTAYKDDDAWLHALPARCQRRTQVVFGSGDPNADLMFVGEAPGFHEDKQGVPFVGAGRQAAREAARTGSGCTRADVYIANVLKCRPPGNRDPQPEEIEACESPPLPADRADPADGRCHARQLRHEAALRQADRDHRACTASSSR